MLCISTFICQHYIQLYMSSLYAVLILPKCFTPNRFPFKFTTSLSAAPFGERLFTMEISISYPLTLEMHMKRIGWIAIDRFQASSEQLKLRCSAVWISPGRECDRMQSLFQIFQTEILWEPLWQLRNSRNSRRNFHRKHAASVTDDRLVDGIHAVCWSY